jgi:hypothetical protein
MNWPIEYEERVRVKGFSILDDDFDVMAGDLCNMVGEESGIDKIRESAATVLKFVATLWQAPIKHVSIGDG